MRYDQQVLLGSFFPRRRTAAAGWHRMLRRASVCAVVLHAVVLSGAASGSADAPGSGGAPEARMAAAIDGPSGEAQSEASTQGGTLDIAEIDELMQRALRSDRAPGAVILVGRRDGVLFRRAYGRRAIVPKREAMTPDTIFDLASLTKPLVIGTLTQWLIENGRLALGDKVATHLPAFGAREKYLVTVEQLLLHTSGLPPTNSLNDYRRGPEKARELALGGWLYKRSGREFIYSDLGYIALGEMIEELTGERLDNLAERVLWRPLRMTDTRFCPRLCDDPRIAPTELNLGWRKNPIRGEPSDTRAYRLGGVAGNAGLFSTADDLARFARMVLGEGELDGVRVLAARSIREMTRPRQVPSASRALGWDVSSAYSTSRGSSLSERAFGHAGYTGTSLWIDPELDLFVVFLSNRNHPWGTGKVIDVQGQVADAAVRALAADGAPEGPEVAAEAPAVRGPEARDDAACPSGACAAGAPLQAAGG